MQRSKFGLNELLGHVRTLLTLGELRIRLSFADPISPATRQCSKNREPSKQRNQNGTD